MVQVEKQIHGLREGYNRKPEAGDNEESNVTVKEIADAKWQSMLERFLTMQDLGNNFINSSNMVRDSGDSSRKIQMFYIFHQLRSAGSF